MKTEDFHRPEAEDVRNNDDRRRVAIPLENNGRIICCSPLDGLRLYVYDIRGGDVPDLSELGLREPVQGKFLRAIICRSGGCEFIKNGCGAVLMANEACLDSGVNSDPHPLGAQHFLGAEIVLELDRYADDRRMAHLFRQAFGNMEKPKGILQSGQLFFFSLNSALPQLDALFDYCFRDADPVIILIKTVEIAYLLCVDINGADSLQRSFVNKSQLTVAQDIYLCLSERYGERWTAAYFAEKYGFSATTVKKWFKSVYGYDFKEFQMKVRMEQAAHLLKESDLSVGEISHRVGYATHAKFGVMFREKFGMTPLEFRRNAKIAQLKGNLAG